VKHEPHLRQSQERCRIEIAISYQWAYFAAVATERVPRVYLVGADRKILWFDLEYTETTRSTLKKAIQAAINAK
jgi:hypothetical protein